jgi:hypothetical protein
MMTRHKPKRKKRKIPTKEGKEHTTPASARAPYPASARPGVIRSYPSPRSRRPARHSRLPASYPSLRSARASPASYGGRQRPTSTRKPRTTSSTGVLGRHVRRR